ncbi:MAG: glycosyltransferase family 39 protein [Planctomycetes bacterium]|nr:glycosyltransferase family 39 protein [Planctomycetota bacterium]
MEAQHEARIGGARGAGLAVLVLVLLALVLRALGVGFALPAAIEDDSGVLVRQVEMVRDGTPAAERDENWTLYPHVIAELAGRFAPDDAPRAEDDTVPELVARAGLVHRYVRGSVLLLALGAIPLAYLVARRFVSGRGATLAAALVATSLLFQGFSQEARPHAAAAAFVLLALHACLVLVERGTLAAFAWAGLASGLALGTLQSNVLVLAPLALACVFAGWPRGFGAPRGTAVPPRDDRRAADAPARGEDGGAGALGAARLVGVAAALAVVALCAWFFYAPSASAHGGKLVELVGAERTLRFFGHNVALGEFDGRGFGIVFWSLWSFEPLACVLALIALGAWLARSRGRVLDHDWFAEPRLFLLVAYALLHLVAIGMYARTYERFCLQLVPLLAVLAAWGAERILVRAPRAWSALLLAWVVFALVPAGRFAELRAGGVAQDEAGAWLAAHARPDERIVLHPLVDVPLLRTSAALAADKRSFTMPWRGYTPWLRYQSRVADEVASNERFDVRAVRPKELAAIESDPAAWLASSGAHYVVLPLQVLREGPEFLRALHRACRERGELAARFPARADGETDVVLGFEDRIESAQPHWAWSLLARSPISVEVVEVWRMP